MHATMNVCLCDNMYSKVRLHLNLAYSFGNSNINNDGCIYDAHQTFDGNYPSNECRA